MEIYNLSQDVKVFGFRVASFPDGIGEAFDTLVHMVPGGFNRSYYGISCMNSEGQMIYHAAAHELHEGEAGKYNCTRYTIEKGDYLAVAVHNWRKKTHSIHEIFHSIMQDGRVDKAKPAVEWYKNDQEMACMIMLQTRFK